MRNAWTLAASCTTRARLTVLLLALVVFTLVARLAGAHSILSKDWEQLVTEAEQIFTGTVTATRSLELPGGAIVTDVVFGHSHVLKGDGGPGPLTLRVFGGTVGAVTLKLSGIPRFEDGRTYVVFARGNGSHVFPIVGGAAGLFQVRREPATGQDLVFGARGETLWTVPVTADAFLEAIEEDLRR
jgi:hypothetical protein